MTLLFILDCLLISAGVVLVMGAAWIAACLLLLGLYNYYEHCVEVNHRMMERFAQTTNYPQYEKYQERCTVAASRLRTVENWLHIVTFC